jgi:hypothetical protein
LQVFKEGIKLILDRVNLLPAIISRKSFEILNKTTTLGSSRRRKRMRSLNKKEMIKGKMTRGKTYKGVDNQGTE